MIWMIKFRGLNLHTQKVLCSTIHAGCNTRHDKDDSRHTILESKAKTFKQNTSAGNEQLQRMPENTSW